MLQSRVLGVLILARNGDRSEFLQDPYSYAPEFTESTPLGAVESFQLGSYLKSTYLDSSSPLHILDMPHDPAHPIPPSQVDVHAKGSGEGAAIFDSSIAVLQGLFPPTPLNKIVLANGSTVVAPLGGYQYVPVEQANGDHVLEPWVNCKAFKKHVSEVYASEEFIQTAKDAQHFFSAVHDYMFGRPATLVDMWNVYDYINTQLIHNQSFAFRLPPTLVEQARGFANYKEDAVFSDNEIGGIGNLAGRAILGPIIKALERIAFEHDDPLRVLLIESSYQPFISLFHMLNVHAGDREPYGIPNYASALVFEVLRGPAPESRDFVRLKFKNGTDDHELHTLQMFDHPEAEVPVTEFIYRLEHHVVQPDKWSSTCSTSWFPFSVDVASVGMLASTRFAFGWVLVLGLLALVARYRKAKQDAVRYETVREDERGLFVNEKARLLPQ